MSLVPSAKNIVGNIARELAPIEAAAATTGAKAGKSLSRGVTQSFGSKIAGFAKASTLPLVGIGVAAVASAKSVEDAQNTILRATGATGKAAAGLEESFKRVAANTPASFATVAETMATLSQRTGLTGKSLEDLTLQVVTFNRITKDSPVAVADLTKTLAAFNIPGVQMGKVLDQLFVTSQKTGVPLNELVDTLQRAGPTVRQFGFPIAQSAGLLATLNKAGVDAGPTIFALRKAFTTFAKEGKEPRKALEDVVGQIGALVKAGDIAGARKIGVQIFGARGVGLVDAAVNGKLSLDALAKTFDTSGAGIRKTAAATSTLSAKLGILKNNAALAFAELGKPIIENLNASLKTALPALKGIASGFASLPKPVQQTTIGLVAIGASVTPITKVSKAIIKNFKSIGEAGVQMGKLARKGFGVLNRAEFEAEVAIRKVAVATFNVGKAFVKTAASIVRQTAAFIAHKVAVAAAAIATKALAVATAILNAVMDANPVVLVVAAIALLAVGIVVAYKKFKPFRDVVDAVGRALLGVFNFVKANWKLLLALLIFPFVGVPLALIKFRSEIVAGLKAAFSAVFNFVRSHWKLLLALLIAPFLPGPIIFVIVKQFAPGILNAILSVLSKIPGQLVQLGLAMLRALGTGLTQGIKFLAIALVGVPILLTVLFVRLQILMLRKGVELLVSLARGLVSALPTIASFFVSLPGRIVGFIGNVGSLLIAKGIALAAGLIAGFVRMQLAIAQFWISLPGKIVAFIGNVGSTLIPKGIALVVGLLTGIVQTIPTVFLFMAGLPGRIVTALGNMAATLVPKGIALIGGFLAGIGQKFVEVTGFFLGVGASIITGLPNMATVLLDAGKDLIQGLFDGIVDKMKGAAGFIKDNVVDPIKDFVTNPLGFFTGSPSKWAMGVGKDIIEGLAVGLTKNTGIATAAARQTVTATKAGFALPTTGTATSLGRGTLAIAAAVPTHAAPPVVHIENLYADGRDQVGKVIADQQRRQYMLSTL